MVEAKEGLDKGCLEGGWWWVLMKCGSVMVCRVWSWMVVRDESSSETQRVESKHRN